MHFAFLIANKYLLPKQTKVLQKYISLRAQLIVWLIYILIFYSYLVSNAPIISLSITAIALGIGWHYWRNVFAGILIKFQNLVQVGDDIETDFVKGKIKTIHLSNTILESADNCIFTVPNYVLNDTILKHKNKISNLKRYSFLVKSTESISLKELHKKALCCPYFVLNQKIEIATTKKGDYKIQAILVDSQLEARVLEFFKT